MCSMHKRTLLNVTPFSFLKCRLIRHIQPKNLLLYLLLKIYTYLVKTEHYFYGYALQHSKTDLILLEQDIKKLQVLVLSKMILRKNLTQ